MNSWVRRSLQASIIAGGFVVLGAGVANAAEPGQAADLGQVGGVVGNVTGTAKSTVDQVTSQAPTAGKATKVTKQAKHAAPKQVKTAKVAPAKDTVGSVTGEVKQTTGKLLGNTPAVEKVHKARTLPAPAKQQATRTEVPAVNEMPAVDQPLGGITADPLAPVTGLVGQSPLGNTATARDADALPASVAGDVVPNVDVTDAGVVAEVVGTLTGTVEESVPATVDLGDHGYVDSVTDVFGTLDGMTYLTADDHGLYGITGISGVLDTASTLTADVPGVASVFGYSSTFATVDAVVEAAGDLSQGDLYGFGAVSGTLDSFNILDVDAGDLGYLTTTASVSGWLDVIGDAYASLSTGDVSGFLAATSTLDAVLTADGQLADLAGLSGVVTASALVDGFLAFAGNVYEGDLFATGSLFAALDATADGYGWVSGLGDVALSSPASSVVVDKTLDLLEVNL